MTFRASVAAAVLVTCAATLRAEPAPAPGPSISFKNRLGIHAGERLLASNDGEVRLRALERLAAQGGRAAIELLVRALESSSQTRTARERLVATRALAPHAADPSVRQALVRVMNAQVDDHDELGRWVRASAALALAASGHEGALSALAAALRQGGALTEVARTALLAHPPRRLDSIVRARGAATAPLVESLGLLGDQRAFELLRDAVRRGGFELSAAAAVALTRLGDLETVELARRWLARPGDPVLLLAAAQILEMTRAPERGTAIERALSEPSTRDQALELLLASAEPPSFDALKRALGGAQTVVAERVIAALGRSRDRRAVALLETELGGARSAAAAYALALTPDAGATPVLERALNEPERRRQALRAAALREWTLSERVRGTRETALSLLGAPAPADRAAAAWTLALLEPDRAVDLVRSRDAVVARAAVRVPLSPGAARACVDRLVKESDPELRAALSVGLAALDEAERVPTAVLLDLLERVPVAAPLAARALAARASPDLYPRIEALLADPDGVLRAHTVRGLGRSRDPRALGWLSAAYRFETDVEVRRAIARALAPARRTARSTLELMAALDPDPGVRAAARAGLAGSAAALVDAGAGTAWLVLAGAPAPGVAAMLLGPTGLALPFVADPDGTASVAGLPPGPFGLRLATLPKHGQAGLP